MTAGLRVRMLGPFEIEGIDLSLLGSRKARRFVRLLASSAGRPVALDRIVDVLWGDAPPSRPNDQISVLASRARRVLGPAAVVRTDAGYALAIDWLDVVELEALATDASRRLAEGRAAAARSAAGAALQLVRGEMLADEADAGWVDEQRSWVLRRVSEVRTVAAEAELAAGQPAAAAILAGQALNADPYDEVALRILMRAHVGAGRPASALAAYASMRARLRDELGVSPAEETEQVHADVLLVERSSPTRSVHDPRTTTGPISSPNGPAPQHEPLRHEPLRHEPLLHEPLLHEPLLHEPLLHEPLPGRAEALRRLDHELERALAGSARVVEVRGEPGIGKSTLIDWWGTGARAAGVPVLRGRNHESLGRLPLQAVIDALAAHLAGQEPAIVDELLREDHAILAPLLGLADQPESGEAAPVAARANVTAADLSALRHSGDPEHHQLVLFNALTRVVDRIANEGAVMMIDDLQFAGPSTRAFLPFLRARSRARLLVIVATRTDVAVADADEIIELMPFDLEAATAIEPDESRARSLIERSGGHPLLFAELAAAPDDALPASIRAAVGARVQQLPDEVAATLQAAAVLGHEVDLDLLAQVLGSSPLAVLDDLERGVAQRFLDESGASLCFRHALVRDAVVANVGGVRRALLHRRAAQALGARGDHDPLDMARHALAAGERHLAAQALGEAAQEAIARYDRAEARRLLDEAIANDDRPDLRVARGLEHLAAGAFTDAVRDAEAARDAGAGAVAFELLGWARYYERDFVGARVAADEGARLATDPAIEASCRVLAGRVLQAAGDLAAADARMTSAEALLDSVRVPVVPIWIGILRTHQSRDREGLDLLDRGLLQPGAIEHPFAVIHAHQGRAHALGHLGLADHALTALDAAEIEVETRRVFDRFGARLHNYRGWILRGLGAFDAADEQNMAALESASVLGHPEPQAHALLDLTEAALAGGDLARADELLGEAVRFHTDTHPMWWRHSIRGGVLRARLALDQHHWDEAEEHASAARGWAADVDAERLAVLAGLTIAWAHAGRGGAVDHTAVQHLVDRLEAVAGLEAWWWQDQLGRVCGVDQWRDQAERSAARLVGHAATHGDQLRRRVARAFER